MKRDQNRRSMLERAQDEWMEGMKRKKAGDDHLTWNEPLQDIPTKKREPEKKQTGALLREIYGMKRKHSGTFRNSMRYAYGYSRRTEAGEGMTSFRENIGTVAVLGFDATRNGRYYVFLNCIRKRLGLE